MAGAFFCPPRLRFPPSSFFESVTAILRGVIRSTTTPFNFGPGTHLRLKSQDEHHQGNEGSAFQHPTCDQHFRLARQQGTSMQGEEQKHECAARGARRVQDNPM